MRILVVYFCMFYVFAFGSDRANINVLEIANITDPFVKEGVSDKNKKMEVIKNEPIFELQAIFDDKAMINNVWLGIGEIMDNFEVINIKQKTVALKRGKQIVILNLFESGGLND